MRVLRLGSSLDLAGDLPPGTRAREVAGQLLSAASGAAVETIVKPVWPSPALPGILERWLKQYEPDIVCICISSYWVETETVSARLRKLGPVGRLADDFASRAAGSPGIASSGPYHAARKAMIRAIGGSTNFTPPQLAAILEACLRRVLRHERVGVVLAGSPFSPDTEATRGARARAVTRRAELIGLLAPLCESLHIPHALPPHWPDAFSPEYRLPDRVHFNERAHAINGASDGALLIQAWQSMRGESVGEPSQAAH